MTRADAPKVLEYGDIRWELEAFGGGTRLTLWHNIDRRFISWGAAGWHICFDVLDRLLSGTPIGRIVGADAMKFDGWQRLNAEYAKQFGIEKPISQRSNLHDEVMPPNVRLFAGFTSSWAFRYSVTFIVRSTNSKLRRPRTRFVFVPVMVLSGLWMWKGHVVRRLFSKGSPQPDAAQKRLPLSEAAQLK